MKKGLWLGLGLLITAHSLFASSPTMSYTSQPAGTVSSLPATLTMLNAAPIPQDLCSATISTGNEQATCTGLPVCKGESTKTASFTCSVTTTCDGQVPSKQNGGNCSISLNVTKPSTLAAATAFTFNVGYGSYSSVLASNPFTLNGTNPLPPADGYRTITFKNSCNQPIWFGSITGAAPTKTTLTGGGIDCTGGNPGKQACVAAGGACYSRTTGPDACFSQACTSDSDCMTGASCHAATSKCYWNNPSPTNNVFELSTSGPGQTNSIQIPEYSANGIGVVWSGAFGGRTGCTSGTCTSGLCTIGTANAQGVCSLGAGFQQPATQAEPTFITYPTNNNTVAPTDAYDVTTINGANVPMSMYAGTPGAPDIPSSGNPFICGAPGYNAQVPSTGSADDVIGPSSWSIGFNQALIPSWVAYRYVVPTVASPARCTTDSDCSGQTCGLTYSSDSIGSTATPGSGYLVCGTFAGWFTADQICGTNNSFTKALGIGNVEVNDFQCNAGITLPAGAPTGTMANLYQCNGNYGNSCYSTGATDTCCGCADWGSDQFLPDFPALPVPTNPSYVTACQTGAKNPSWTGDFSGNQPQVYDTIYFLKKACPSCYVYPFDDASSSFTCTTGSTSTNNAKNYTVEFCPDGNGSSNFAP